MLIRSQIRKVKVREKQERDVTFEIGLGDCWGRWGRGGRCPFRLHSTRCGSTQQQWIMMYTLPVGVTLALLAIHKGMGSSTQWPTIPTLPWGSESCMGTDVRRTNSGGNQEGPRNRIWRPNWVRIFQVLRFSKYCDFVNILKTVFCCRCFFYFFYSVWCNCWGSAFCRSSYFGASGEPDGQLGAPERPLVA